MARATYSVSSVIELGSEEVAFSIFLLCHHFFDFPLTFTIIGLPRYMLIVLHDDEDISFMEDLVEKSMKKAHMDGNYPRYHPYNFDGDTTVQNLTADMYSEVHAHMRIKPNTESLTKKKKKKKKKKRFPFLFGLDE